MKRLALAFATFALAASLPSSPASAGFWDSIKHAVGSAIDWASKKVASATHLGEAFKTIDGRRYIMGPPGVKHELTSVRAMVGGTARVAPRTFALTAATVAKAPRKSVDLRAGFPSIRNQWWRGTCVAFATMAGLEYALKKQPGELSEQYAYWLYKSSESGAQRCEGGTNLLNAAAQLTTHGVPPASDWGYSYLDPRELFRKDCFQKETWTEGSPPAAAQRNARYYVKSYVRIAAPADPAALIAVLDAGHPIVYAATVAGTDWRSWSSWFASKIDVQLDKDKKPLTSHDSHAFVLVGYDLDKKAFLMRNSWGLFWGHLGYHWLSFDYVKTYGLEGFYLTEVGQK